MTMSNRARAYQWLFHEVRLPSAPWSVQTDNDDAFALYAAGRIQADLRSEEDRDRDMERAEETFQALVDRVIAIAREVGTDRQLECLDLFMTPGMTQFDMGKKLGTNQSTVQKSLYGNVYYDDGRYGERFGGLFKKVRETCEGDPEFLRLYQEYRTAMEPDLTPDYFNPDRGKDQ